MNERGIEIIYGIFNIHFFEAFFIVYFICVGNLQSLSSTGNIFVCVNIPFKYAKFGPLFFFFISFSIFFYGASITDKDDHFTKTCIKIG